MWHPVLVIDACASGRRQDIDATGVEIFDDDKKDLRRTFKNRFSGNM
jgi:hypothetical protein